ncbi:MAG: hypothetical protein IJ634_06485 [Bacteroidales bacterium]|nr:hypothetical protein [Bacteroidales bacterium]
MKTNTLMCILRWCTFDTIELKDGYILRTWKIFGIKSGVTDAFKAERAVFCDSGNGLFGKNLFFGSVVKTVEDYQETVKVGDVTCENEIGMDIYGLKKENADAIRKYIVDCGAKLGDDSGEVFYANFPWMKPLRWFMPRESLRFGKEGIFHSVKTIRRNRTSYIPYADLKVFNGYGWFGKKLSLLGDVSINTKERFPKETYNKCKELVDKRAKVLSAEGKMYRPALLSFKKRNRFILPLDKGFIARDKKKMYYFDYNDIVNYGFEKKRWWSLFGKFWCVSDRNDARDYSLTQGWFEDTVREFEVPGILFWRWRYLFFFRGSLKKELKAKCKQAKEQVKQIAKQAHRNDRANVGE